MRPIKLRDQQIQRLEQLGRQIAPYIYITTNLSLKSLMQKPHTYLQISNLSILPIYNPIHSKNKIDTSKKFNKPKGDIWPRVSSTYAFNWYLFKPWDIKYTHIYTKHGEYRILNCPWNNHTTKNSLTPQHIGGEFAPVGVCRIAEMHGVVCIYATPWGFDEISGKWQTLCTFRMFYCPKATVEKCKADAIKMWRKK